MAEILRSSKHEARWVVPIGGGYEPVEITVDTDAEDLCRFGVGAARTGPDAEELRAISLAAAEAADAMEPKGE